MSFRLVEPGFNRLYCGTNTRWQATHGIANFQLRYFFICPCTVRISCHHKYFFLEQPWDDYSCPIRVGRNITSLKWSQSGEKLLIGDSLGRLVLFKMHEYSSSEWDQEILYEGMG